MRQTIIIPRRKLYEHILILEDFILDIERYVLYDKESKNIYKYSGNEEFEPLLHEIIYKTLHLSNIFFTKKVFHSVNEFEKELKIQYTRDVVRCIDEFKQHITNNFKVNNEYKSYIEQIENLLNFIKQHKRWGSDRELTNQFFKLIDSYHSILIKIIELSN